jgi:hypothetical protein
MLNILEGFDLKSFGHNSAESTCTCSSKRSESLCRPRRLPGGPGFRPAGVLKR